MNAGFFTNMNYLTPCSGCSGIANQGTCSFTCGAGMITTGNNTMTCNTNLTSAWWSGAPITCTFPPPSFVCSALTVNEFSPVNALVGSPLYATINSPNDQVLFQINDVSVRRHNSNKVIMFWYRWPPRQVNMAMSTVRSGLIAALVK